ncbi:MAG: pyridoxine 5'-phosphate synthase [Gammaproteobacteria bacterium]|nr:MAG: pyridoxine 5'-phosphate synthase [Gammaproteobacteria bacterium]
MGNIRLGVNIDHVATLRQSRLTRFPDPVHAAHEAELGGADGITLHLREDRRHIQERDVTLLKQTLQSPMNLEMAMTDEMVELALQFLPQNCCIVPEKRQELTTEGGLDVLGQLERLKSVCKRLKEAEIVVSLFIDPELPQIDAALEAGAPVIELHTGHYADAEDSRNQCRQLAKIVGAVEYAHEKGLMINAGHGLHYHNVQAIAAIPHIHELNIGHAIVSRAVFVGLREAVREMKQLMTGVDRRVVS